MYFPLPLLTTEGYISMGNTLLEVAPKQPPAHVGVSIGELADVVAEAEAGLVARIDEDLSTKLERLFDIFVDVVWNEFNSRLEFQQVYLHKGAAKLSDEDREKLDFDQRVADARTAAMVHEKLFGGGSNFLRARYAQQATHMAARIDWIDLKQHGEALDRVVSPELMRLLRVCQPRYEAMVNERNSRAGKSAANLTVLRNKLRCQLYSYCGVIGSMVSPAKPEATAIVEAALLPILVIREQNRRKGPGGEVGEELGKVVAELEAQEQGEAEQQEPAEDEDEAEFEAEVEDFEAGDDESEESDEEL